MKDPSADGCLTGNKNGTGAQEGPNEGKTVIVSII